MLKTVQILIAGILTSFYYFPVEFVAFPGVNTKMMLAVLGLVFVVFSLIQKGSLSITKDFLWLVILAGLVSTISLLSITINQTPDTSYVGYIVSFAIWLSGAYAVCWIIRQIHGYISVQLVLDYLVGVCVFQCASALVIDSVPVVKYLVDRTFSLDQATMTRVRRIYGIGAALDVAGLRFSAILAGLGFYLSEMKVPLKSGRRATYILSFLFITVAGNMVARTTLVGVLIGTLIVLLGFFHKSKSSAKTTQASSVLMWTVFLAAVIILCVSLYNTYPYARKMLRFGFEGFFSLAEKGHWETASTETIAKTMVVFPETLHTWVIGDGYFMNSNYDPNYLGEYSNDQGYYMGTDVGYLRFLFYFGVLGLILIMAVIIYSAVICMRRFREDWLLFLSVLLVGLIVWLKVSTDIFCFFAPFLCVSALLEDNSDPIKNEYA